MKKRLYIAISALMLLSLSACHKVTTEGMTRTTYYPVIKLEGDEFMIVDKGSTFKEPGYSATLNDKDITSEVIVDSDVNTSVSGVYSISYSAVNEDGFVASSHRTVAVIDSKDPVEGVYVTNPASQRVDTKKNFGGYLVVILGLGDGKYAIDDCLAGWYCYGKGYGTAYQMNGVLSVASDGTVSLIESYIAGWGDSLDSLEDGKFDSATGTLSYTCVYVGMPFNIILNKM